MLVKRKTESAFRLAPREIVDWWRYEGGREQWLREQDAAREGGYG
jgi:hypothetical protein